MVCSRAAGCPQAQPGAARAALSAMCAWRAPARVAPMAEGLTLDSERRAGTHLRVRRWRFFGRQYTERHMAEHAGVELGWVQHGALTYRVGNTRLVAHPGMAVVVPTRREHATDVAGAMQGATLLLGEDLLAEVAEASGLRVAAMAPSVLTLPGIAQLAELVANEAALEGPGHHLKLDALLQALAVDVLRHASAADARDVHGVTDARMAQLLHRVNQRPEHDWTLELLARLCGMSRFHFSRSFKQQVGQSPYQYVLAARLKRAAELLRSGHHSVAEAALTAGFPDAGRFTAQFRRWAGCTPGQYQKRQRAGRTGKSAYPRWAPDGTVS